MSRKITALFMGVLASLAVAAGTMQGCGGSSGSNAAATCQKVCDKVLACTPDAGSLGEQVAMQCKQNCTNQANSMHCSNESAITSAINNCLAMDCAGATACIQTVPACQSTTGSGGSTGAGGTTGSGGTSGGGDCGVCTTADACCSALANGQACNLAQSCAATTGANQQQVIMGCMGVLTSARMLADPPSACLP